MARSKKEAGFWTTLVAEAQERAALAKSARVATSTNTGVGVGVISV
jgi:hypothetical protein